MKNIMLGKVVRKVVGLPGDDLGILYDLTTRLAGLDGHIYSRELKKFLRKEDCWKTEAEKPPILTRLYPNEKILVGATDGTETIAISGDIFTGSLDKDFENWGTNKSSGRATEPVPAEVYELRQNVTFREMSDSLGRGIDGLCWEQGQIINFCREHRDKLRPKGWANFFLFKVEGEEEPFVAGVGLGSGELGASVRRLGYGGVWGAEYRYRVVVPQLVS